MKIPPSFVNPSHGPSRTAEVRGEARSSERSEGPGPRHSERVQVSDAARFVERVREAAREEAGIRTDEVERVRLALAEGTYESSVDLDQLVNRLLGDL
jgi:anti-sigma28 factor (negative regulator of flagellin synthesis)